ncbi:MAG: hypothetical protein GY909_09475 [Oligoflexia bacterium]|nr:hypothetical protein [Oligoflexia bacterium]
MKKIALALMLIGFVGCASNSRGVSSDGSPICSLEKHPKKDWYRFQMHGKPYNKFWYSEKKAQGHMDEYVASGRCD